MINKIFIIIASSFFVTACYEEDALERPFTTLRTLEVTDINSNGLNFNAEIIDVSNEVISDYGFVWDTETPTLQSAYSISLGIKADSNPYFIAGVNSGLKTNMTYIVRAYVKTKTLVVYGNTQTFMSLGGEGPIIQSVTPLEGVPGDTLKIEVQNLVSAYNGFSIEFNRFEGKIIASYGGEILVIVPKGLTEKENTVSIRIGQEVNSFSEKFVLL